MITGEEEDSTNYAGAKKMKSKTPHTYYVHQG